MADTKLPVEMTKNTTFGTMTKAALKGKMDALAGCFKTKLSDAAVDSVEKKDDELTIKMDGPVQSNLGLFIEGSIKLEFGLVEPPHGGTSSLKMICKCKVASAKKETAEAGVPKTSKLITEAFTAAKNLLS
jgi:hypothetical protein